MGMTKDGEPMDWTPAVNNGGGAWEGLSAGSVTSVVNRARANSPAPPRDERGAVRAPTAAQRAQGMTERPPPSQAMLQALQNGGGIDQRALGYVAQGQIANPRQNKHFSIKIEHLPTNEEVSFDGWITQFADNFTSQWNGTPVYGRMDDLYTFQRTGRKVSIAFDVVAVDVKEGVLNQYNMNRLAQFLYPVYTEAADPAFQVLSGCTLIAYEVQRLGAKFNKQSRPRRLFAGLFLRTKYRGGPYDHGGSNWRVS